MAKSFVSIDSITVSAAVEWKTKGDDLLRTLRNNIPKIDSAYIDSIFGEGKMVSVRESGFALRVAT